MKEGTVRLVHVFTRLPNTCSLHSGSFHAGAETQDKMTKIDGTNLLFNLKYNFKWCKNYDAKMNFKILYHHISV